MIEIERVELDYTQIANLVEEGYRVRDTPHLGGPHSAKYALTLGGLASEVVLVDTIKAARDKFGRAGDVSGVRFISNKRGERMPAAALNNINLRESDGVQLLRVMGDLGIEDTTRFYVDGTANFVDLHTHCVENTVAGDVSVVSFAELWRKTGELGTAMMEYMASHEMLRRWYDSSSEKVTEVKGNQMSCLQHEGSYFDDADEIHGMLPPVEAMFAIEAAQAVVEGRDVVYDHLYVMSTEYTKEANVKGSILNIAEGTLALLGLTNGNLRYRLLVANNRLLDQIGQEANHFSMMQEGRRFNARSLIKEWEATNAK